MIIPRWLAAAVKKSSWTAGRQARLALPDRLHCYSYRPQVEALEDRLTPSSVSGEAFGVSVNLTAPVAVSVPKTPDVVLPPNGGMQQADLVGLNQQGVISTSVLDVSTEGSIGPHSASAVSQASVDKLNLLNGFITADIVEAMSTSVSNGTTATSSAAGSGFFNLVVNRTPIAANVAPNTTIVIPMVGTVILNEEIFGGDGVHSTSLTVDMIDVMLNGSLGSGEIIVSSAHSDVNFTTPGPSPGQGKVFMTGGGRLGSGPKNFATFGFNAGLDNGVPKGQLEYQDHGQDLNFHGTSITAFSVDSNDPRCVTFSGTGRLNGVDGYTFTVHACDYGDPGAGTDTFRISITGPNGFNYSSNGFYKDVITAGNIQEHG
jgi:hypothetical protein